MLCRTAVNLQHPTQCSISILLPFAQLVSPLQGTRGRPGIHRMWRTIAGPAISNTPRQWKILRPRLGRCITRGTRGQSGIERGHCSRRGKNNNNVRKKIAEGRLRSRNENCCILLPLGAVGVPFTRKTQSARQSSDHAIAESSHALGAVSNTRRSTRGRPGIHRMQHCTVSSSPQPAPARAPGQNPPVLDAVDDTNRGTLGRSDTLIGSPWRRLPLHKGRLTQCCEACCRRSRRWLNWNDDDGVERERESKGR